MKSLGHTAVLEAPVSVQNQTPLLDRIAQHLAESLAPKPIDLTDYSAEWGNLIDEMKADGVYSTGTAILWLRHKRRVYSQLGIALLSSGRMTWEDMCAKA